MNKLKTVLIMAGGTGGHVFPGLALAQAMRDKGVEVHWLGTQKGLEAKLVPQAGIPIHYVSIGGLRGKGWKTLLQAPWRLLVALWQSIRIIRRLQPDIVLGMGGFVGGPGGLATWLLRRRLVIHEQNAKAGFTNQCLSHLAAKVLEAFPNTFSQRHRVITTGNPVRKEIVNLPPPADRLSRRNGKLRLLVVGGSLGAAAMNEMVPRALAKMPEAERPEIKHQTGEKFYSETVKAYESAKISADVVPFITQMAQAYEWADIVLCRAGALTVSELCAAGVGAVLVPFPYAVDDHQTINAEYMVKSQAAIVIQQKELTDELLIDWIRKLNPMTTRLAMAQAAFSLRKTDATEKVLRICEEVCH